jgi:hypothetical protein
MSFTEARTVIVAVDMVPPRMGAAAATSGMQSTRAESTERAIAESSGERRVVVNRDAGMTNVTGA